PGDEDYADKYDRALRETSFDLVIFDRSAPPARKQGEASPLPPASTFFIDQLPPPWGPLTDRERDSKRVKTIPRILNPSHRHPLMKHLTGLDEILFAQAFRYELDPDKDDRLPPNLVRLLETEKDGAVLFALPRGAFTDVVLTATLVTDDGRWASNWQGMPGFPLFLSNLLFTLGHVRDAPTEENTRPGEVKVIRPEMVVDEVEVKAPGAADYEKAERDS